MSRWTRWRHRKQPDADVMIEELHYKDGTLHLRSHHPTIAFLAGEAVRFFKESGGTNYVSMALSDPSDGEVYELTLQRLEGRLPAAVNAELKAALREIYEWTDHKDTPWALRAKKILEG